MMIPAELHYQLASSVFKAAAAESFRLFGMHWSIKARSIMWPATQLASISQR